MSRITFFIAEALRALRRNAAPSIAAVVTIVVTTLLLGVLVPVLRASESKTNDVRSQIALRVYLFPDAAKGEISSLQHRLNNLPHVASTQYVGKAEALKILRTRVSGDLAHSIGPNGELKSNPLPPSFNVTIDDANNLEAVRQAIEPDRSLRQAEADQLDHRVGQRLAPGGQQDPLGHRTRSRSSSR